ncbi:MAG: hypothetical protein LBH63_00675 [Clostridiales Family XIII bacterium]|jgi:hypothetical protein|nr:hypothetical protein [Clostridiales Family XIII bacterium]
MNDYAVYAIVALFATAGGLCLSPAKIRAKFDTGRMRRWAATAKTNLSAERLRERYRHEKADREIFEAISFIRNIVAARKGDRIPADLLLEQLAQSDGVLKPAYIKALSLLRVNRKAEMVAVFSDAAGTNAARDFIRIIVRWDEVSPEKLSSTLLSYQSAMKEMRTTELKRKNELLSDMVFFPVVVNVLVVFMNFIFVAYFIEQRDLLRELFF